MPLYYDMRFVSALVSVPICIIGFACYGISWCWPPWLVMAIYFSPHSLIPFYYLWLRPPDLQLNNAAPANGNAMQLQRGRLQHLPDLPRMLADIFQCLPRVALDACQLVSRQFRDAVEDARTTLPLHSMRVDLDLECEAYANELDDLFRFTDRHDICWMRVIYKRSLITPGCDFLSALFAEARNRSLSVLTVSLASAKAKNCDVEQQLGLQVLNEIIQDQKRPSAEHLSVIVPRLKGFRLLRRIAQAYARGEITRPLMIGCDASVSMAELWPENGFVVGEEHSASMGPAYGFGPASMTVHTNGVTNYYVFSLPC